MNLYIDIHTHRHQPSPSSIINYFPEEIQPSLQQHPSQMCSIGLHPWHIAQSNRQALHEVEKYAAYPNVYAIGEAGLDKLTNTPITIQQEIFIQQYTIAAKVQKPLIIHCVKAYSELIRLKKELHPDVAWIIHGFRGKLTIAQELINHDFCLSFGKGLSFLENTIANIPIERVFLETDDSETDIKQIYQQFAKIRQIPVETLKNQMNENFKQIFKNSITC